MFMVKKLVDEPLHSTMAPRCNKIFFLKDRSFGIRFLVDTGAARSLLPATRWKALGSKLDPIQLTAANGTPIPVYGNKHLKITINGRSYGWTFVVADVTLPLLGADFLAHYQLLVDVAGCRLVDAASLSATPMTAIPSDFVVQVVNIAGEFAHLRSKFSDVFKPELRQQPQGVAKHGIYHRIQTSGPPVFSKFRRLAPDKLAAAKHTFAELERLGICQKASSPWASPLHIVTKKDGTLRPCGDYRRLNIKTEPDHYPLPNITDLTSFLNGAAIFSRLDLLKGYYQVPMHPDDIPKTAVTTPFGTFTFNYSCFGLRNSGATFQRMMDGVLGDLPFCACYVDDILIFSPSKEDHLQHLHKVLERLQQNGLVVRYDKCVFGVKEVDFLGHRLTSEGVAPLPEKISSIGKFPTPTTVKALQEFVGMVNFYHRFIPKIASIMAPLYSVLAGRPKELTWGPAQADAFQRAKESLIASSLLAFPVPGQPFILTTDASDVAMGAVLEQRINGHPRPLGFFSRKLLKAERNYSTFDRELLAVHQAIRHFRHLLEGSTFVVQTDHLPLVHAYTKQGDAWSQRQRRQLSAISEFNCSFRHLPGKKNPVADALSRVEIGAVQLGLDYSALAEEQQKDPETAAARTSITGLKWKDVILGDSDTSILCDISTGRPRPWVPSSLRRRVFDLIHGLSHPSRRATARLLKQKFVWHGISRDAGNWVRSCTPCQKSKVHRHTETGPATFHQPSRRFAHIHVDVVGPLPPSEGCRYVFTIIDRSTRWPEAIPMSNATSASCALSLLSGWISRFGIPDHITSDRGTTFTSQLWISLGQLMGTTVHHTTAYNPEANGMVERFHRTLKAALMSRCNGPVWLSQLPWVLLGLRTTPKDDLNVSPAEMVYGDPLVVPGEFFPDAPTTTDVARLRGVVGKFAPCKQTYRPSGQRYVPRDLFKTKYVFLRTDAHSPALSPPYSGPYEVIERKKKAFLLRVKGADDWISVDRLKPAYLQDDDPPPVQFSRAGRPLAQPQRYTS